jgi:D-glycero-D-manno-heptose 1,7-bisphosphate phosphatase
MTKVVFLDRDGTINVDSDNGYVYKISDWQFTPKAPEALKSLQEAGYVLALITSQSGIAHGLYTEADMHKLHDYMNEELKKYDVSIDAIGFCPHARNQTDCDCRKPKIGMAKQIEQKLGPINYVQSWTIGDKVADLGFGKKAGTQTALIRSDYWQESELIDQPDMIVDSLYDFAQQII